MVWKWVLSYLSISRSAFSIRQASSKNAWIDYFAWRNLISVGMLGIEKDVKLPNNNYSAFAHLKSLEKRLEKDPDLKKSYDKTIQDDLEMGYIVPIEYKELNTLTDCEWYLPYHPVVIPNKPGKVRQILNGAPKSHVVSLNQSLLVGADLLQNLLRVLLRFRPSLRFFVAGGPHKWGKRFSIHTSHH